MSPPERRPLNDRTSCRQSSCPCAYVHALPFRQYEPAMKYLQGPVCDLKENSPDIDIVQYADDCTLLIPVTPEEDITVVTKRYVQRFVDYCAANRIAAEPDKTQLLHLRATRPQQPRASFAKIQAYLPGRWRATSPDFEVPAITVDRDLIAHFDDGTAHPLTEDPDGDCAMLDWSVSDRRGRSIYWRNEEGASIKWTKYVQQPAATGSKHSSPTDHGDDSDESDEDSDSSDTSEDADDELLPSACRLGGQDVQWKHCIQVLGMHIDDQLSWRQHCQAAAAKTRNALAAVRRAARHLWAEDRIAMAKALTDKRLAELRLEKKAQARLRKQAKQALQVTPVEQDAFDCRLLHIYRDKASHSEPDGVARVWTDGSTLDNQNQARRKAGAGVFYGNDHPLNNSIL
eukprot:gene8460-7755_t